jgi:hypothetical protein
MKKARENAGKAFELVRGWLAQVVYPEGHEVSHLNEKTIKRRPKRPRPTDEGN